MNPIVECMLSSAGIAKMVAQLSSNALAMYELRGLLVTLTSKEDLFGAIKTSFPWRHSSQSIICYLILITRVCTRATINMC